MKHTMVLMRNGWLDYPNNGTGKKSNVQMIIAGASAYPRAIDFAMFREIADAVGAYLLVDMAHYS